MSATNKRRATEDLEQPDPKRQKGTSYTPKRIFSESIITNKEHGVAAATESCLALRLLAESFKKFIGHANFDLDETGMRMTSMDTSNISLIKLTLNASGFTEGFRCDQPVALGINFDSMHKILKGRQKTAMAIQVPNVSEPDTVTFVFKEEDRGKESEWEMKLMDIDSQMLGIPDIEYPTVVRIPSKEFIKIVTEIAEFGENIMFSGDGERFSISTKGDEGKCKITLVDGEDNVEIKSCVESNTTYPSKHLQMFSKASAVAETVELRLDATMENAQGEMEPMPMCVVCRLPNDAGELVYYLAARINQD